MAGPGWAWQRLGYKVYFCGRGGTGFVAANGATGNYIDALQRGDWKLPYGTPPLVVIQGGGNDAGRGASDAQIVANADRLIETLARRYPARRWSMIGTLAPRRQPWRRPPRPRWMPFWARWLPGTACRSSASATG